MTTFEYDGYATALERRTWADGYGNWHTVLETEGTGSTLPPASEAVCVIRRELELRHAPNFDPSTVAVVLREVEPTADGIRWHYMEVPA